MFPNKVYYCPCLKVDVMMCLVNGDYCLKDIIRKLKKCQAKRVFFCTKCGNDKRNVIFSCVDHMRLKTFLVGEKCNLYCLSLLIIASFVSLDFKNSLIIFKKRHFYHLIH